MMQSNQINLTKDNTTLVYLNTKSDPKALLELKKVKAYLIPNEKKSLEYIRALTGVMVKRTRLLERNRVETFEEYNAISDKPMNLITVVVDDAKVCVKHESLLDVLSVIQEYSERLGILIIMCSPTKYVPELKLEGNTLCQHLSPTQLDIYTGKLERVTK